MLKKENPLVYYRCYLIIMVKFVEMDERVKFKEQIKEKEIDGEF
jgi:hypothetical protein